MVEAGVDPKVGAKFSAPETSKSFLDLAMSAWLLTNMLATSSTLKLHKMCRISATCALLTDADYNRKHHAQLIIFRGGRAKFFFDRRRQRPLAFQLVRQFGAQRSWRFARAAERQVPDSWLWSSARRDQKAVHPSTRPLLQIGLDCGSTGKIDKVLVHSQRSFAELLRGNVLRQGERIGGGVRPAH
jgi:hypothetical protein